LQGTCGLRSVPLHLGRVSHWHDAACACTQKGIKLQKNMAFHTSNEPVELNKLSEDFGVIIRACSCSHAYLLAI
jgi:hypothetical protein